jgi:hypothetical protein
MEIILAIVVVGAVVFFGALISAGNERQRKAIDSLREQAVLWAMQDLRIKRESLARDVQVPDPLGWLNRIVAKICGSNLGLQVAEAFDEPRTLICTVGNGTSRIVFTTFSPDQIRRFKNERRGRLSQYTDQNPLFSLPSQAMVYEISPLNGGIVFDLELPIAWNALTKQKVDQMDRIWMYVIL